MYYQNSFLSSLSYCSIPATGKLLRAFFVACVVQVLLLAGSFLLVPNYAKAITIDNFAGAQSVESQGGSNSTQSSILATTNALGGFRALDTTSPIGNIALKVTARTTGNTPASFLSHDQDSTVTAITRVHWDGNANANLLDPTGLGGVDLTEDGATAFILERLDLDATAQNVTITIRVFDASDATANRYSEYQLNINGPITFTDISIPFNTPFASGPNGNADLTNVGAILLTINGPTPASDIVLDGFKTNGFCDLIPGIGGSALDDCGECIPPNDPLFNQSCVDCLGIPNGNTLPGDSCDTGQEGPCADGIFNGQCKCTRINNPKVETCDGVDNNCNGEIDETFPQLGLSCGKNEPGCTVVGIYTCDASGGVKCDIDYSQSDLTNCGIDIGCDGIPGSGAKPDVCGICGGDGSTCKDLGCESQDIFDLQASLDGQAKLQEKRIRQTARQVRRNTNRKRIRNELRNIVQNAHSLMISNWILSWTLPTIIVNCNGALSEEFCTSVSNQDEIDVYIQDSENLRNLGRRTVRLLSQVGGDPREVNRWRRRHNQIHKNNVQLANSVPAFTQSCVGPASI